MRIREVFVVSSHQGVRAVFILERQLIAWLRQNKHDLKHFTVAAWSGEKYTFVDIDRLLA